MTSVYVPTHDDIYKIALLVSKGWTKDYEDRWTHPSGKKFSEVQNSFYETIEVDTWPFDDAVYEAQYGEG